MIYDSWREQNSPGEVNPYPSLTQPCRVFSVMDYLTRPDLVLQERHPFAEVEIDPSDPTALDKVPDPDDVFDSFEYEVPRDPDLYSNSVTSKRKKPKVKTDGAPAPEPGASAPTIQAPQEPGVEVKGAESQD